MVTFTTKSAASPYTFWADLMQMDFFSDDLTVTRSATHYSASWTRPEGVVEVDFAGTGMVFSSGSFPDGGRPLAGTVTGMTIRVDGAVWLTATDLGKDAADIDHFWSGWDQNGNYRNGDGFDLMSFLASGDDKIFGSANGDDMFSGRNPGNDSVYGGGGDDFIKADQGNDLVSGGTDWDTYSLSEANWDPSAYTGANVNLATGTAIDNWGGRDTLSGIEQVEGSRFRDVITGSGRSENISGMKGADTLSGAGGYDTLDYSRDVERGGAKGVVVNLATGRGVDGWGNADRISGFEEVRGTGKADTLTGNDLANQLQGGNGGDSLAGAGGADTLIGDFGADTMAGGAGSDSFVFGAWDGDPFGDTIRDFVSGTDNLFFDTASFDGMSSVLKFETGTASTRSGSAFYFDTGAKQLWWDADGSGSGDAVLVAKLSTGTIVAGDIVLG